MVLSMLEISQTTKACRRTRFTLALAMVASLTALTAFAAPVSACAAGCGDGSSLINTLLQAGSPNACTTQNASCTFTCERGDILYVAGNGGLNFHAYATCGGRMAECAPGLLGGACAGESDDRVAVADVGVCEASVLTGHYTVSCASAPPVEEEEV